MLSLFLVYLIMLRIYLVLSSFELGLLLSGKRCLVRISAE